MDKSKFKGHLAAFTAYAIFGINIVSTKDISNCGLIQPMVLFTFRAIGATSLFWLISLFLPKEKISPKDLGLTVIASFLGLFLTQTSFLKAITCTTAIDVSIMGSVSPIFTMFVAAIFLKEPITWKKAFGVFLSFGGIVYLILNSISISHGADRTTPLGVLMMFVNAASFACYLGIFRPLIEKYSVVTFMKWMFLFSLLMALPFSAKWLATTPYGEIGMKVWLEVGFLVLFATFVSYFLIPYSQQRLRPTLVSMYTYLQPTLAVIISILTGIDHMSIRKAVAMVLVLLGVIIVNRSRALDRGGAAGGTAK